MFTDNRSDSIESVFRAHLDDWEARPEVDVAADVAEHDTVERVARAICEADGREWEHVSQQFASYYRRLACAAVAAMPPADEALRDEPPCKVGDPDPTDHPGRDCGREEAEDGFVCTRETGHPADWHIAGDSVTVCAVWPAHASLGGGS